MKIKIDKKDCGKEDLKIPEGYRLIKDWEFLKGVREGDKKLTLLARKGWIWVDIGKNIKAAAFYYRNGELHFDGNGNIDDRDRSLGLFVKINRKKKS